MSKQSLLLVDGDTRSLRVLEVSLRKAGFSVTAAVNVQDALDKLEVHAPDLIISETSFTNGLDGFELRRRLRENPEHTGIPFIFLTAETAISNKIRGLELGVDDYLTKPIYIKEIVTRINILLTKRQRSKLDERKDGTRFAGRVADMPVVDVIQTIEISRKSGVINFTGERGRQAAIYFRDGRVIDAEAGTLQGEDAVYRLLTWSEGEFEVTFRIVRRREAITASSQALLMEGMRRLDEWSRLLEQLPPLSHRFEVDIDELTARLGEIPDDNNRILRLIDGKRSLIEVIDASDFGDLECLQAVSRLYFEGLLIDLDPHERPKRDTGKPMPLVTLEEGMATTIEEVERPAEEPARPLDDWSHQPTLKPGQTRAAAAHLAANPPAEATGPTATEPAPKDTAGPEPTATEPASRAAAATEEPAATEPTPTEPAPEEMQADEPYTEEPPEGPLADEPVTVSPDAIDDEAPEPYDEPGPLMGGYRPSSLRLIDEAVAAAQAIEPSLFEDRNEPATPRVPDPIGAESDSAPIAIVEDEPSRPPKPRAASATNGANGHPRAASEAAASKPALVEAEAATTVSRRTPATGVRMIGSLGRDRAEASGELMPPPERSADASEPQREMVTILPRRITREIPTVQVSTDTPETADASQVAEAPPGTSTPAAPAVAPVEPVVKINAPARSQPRVNVGGGVSASRGPGGLARAMLVAAGVLLIAAGYVTCHKHGRTTTPAPGAGANGSDAAVALVAPMDAAPLVEAVDATAVAVDPVPADAATSRRHRDAAVASAFPDARVRVRADANEDVVHTPADAREAVVHAAADARQVVRATDPAVDDTKQARALMDQARDAMDTGDFNKALDLADQSLKLRKSARTFLVKAQALQRLNRIDDALAAIDESMGMLPDYAPAWELRGMILWSARRYPEAHAALGRYLELEPDGKDAPTIRRLLSEPQ